MRLKIFNDKKYPKSCKNCVYGAMPEDNSAILCEKKGAVDPDGCCRKYRYDPLKRKPNKPEIFKGYSEEDFKL